MFADEWIWMPHPAHFIGGSSCKFFLSTYVGGYIVSTVGEYTPGKKHEEYLNRGSIFKFEDIGFARTYETMVFNAKRSKEICCPFEIMNAGEELDFAGYNDAGEARKGHYKLCRMWSNK